MLLRILPICFASLLVPSARPTDGFASAATPAPVAVLDLRVLEKGLPKSWELDENSGEVDVLFVAEQAREGHSWIRVEEVEGDQEQRQLSLYCQNASFSLNRDLSDLELDAHTVLEWEWQASALPAQADMRESKRNDQALQVLVKFDTTKKRVISYVWDTSAPVETQISESYALGLYQVRVLCVQSGAQGLGDWHKLRRDLRADYKTLYGSDDYPGVAGIRIQSNSQYTKTVAAGAVKSLTFHPGAAPARN